MQSDQTQTTDTDAVLDSLNLSVEQETQLIALLVETRRAARAEVYAEWMASCAMNGTCKKNG